MIVVVAGLISFFIAYIFSPDYGQIRRCDECGTDIGLDGSCECT